MYFYTPKKRPVQHERNLQIGLVQKFRTRGDYGLTFTLHHSPNEGDAKPQYRATLNDMGVEPGQPDLEFYLLGGRIVLIELKHGNRASKAQRLKGAQPERHETFKKLGFEIHTIIDDCPDIAYHRISALLDLP